MSALQVVGVGSTVTRERRRRQCSFSEHRMVASLGRMPIGRPLATRGTLMRPCFFGGTPADLSLAFLFCSLFFPKDLQIIPLSQKQICTRHLLLDAFFSPTLRPALSAQIDPTLVGRPRLQAPVLRSPFSESVWPYKLCFLSFLFLPLLSLSSIFTALLPSEKWDSSPSLLLPPSLLVTKSLLFLLVSTFQLNPCSWY